jgi:putative ABC transport system permease protein
LFMRRFLAIVGSSFKIAMLELWKAKLRTFLSLFGITIGIFCIIGVLTTVSSLEQNLQTEIKSLGTNTIYVDKWQYSAGADYPYWKYVKRPVPRFDEITEIKERTATARYAAFKISAQSNVEGGENIAQRIRIYGISEDFTKIQPVEIQYGRSLSGADFFRGLNTVVIGYNLAQSLFNDPEIALNKTIKVRGQRAVVVGVMKKKGTQLIGGWGFDECVLMPYQTARTIMDERRADPLILVQGKEGINSKVLQDDLKGTMRAVRKLSPKEEDNFALNDVNDFSDKLSDAFVNINRGGWIIGALAFVVGIFGVANIMFVTVTERRAQIGLKKAIGAKKDSIITEFLLESAFLCILGGLIGLLLIFVLAKIATSLLDFPIFLSAPIIGIAIFICIVAGILAGMIPAIRAARMDPVVAIRS